MSLEKKYKASRYNHFIPLGDGERLAFNAISCGLAKMDEESYNKYKTIINGASEESAKADDVFQKLKEGKFVVVEDYDELDWLKAVHYRQRFGSVGLGLTLVPTLRCNFACTYCYEPHEVHNKGPSMGQEVQGAVVDFVQDRLRPGASLNLSWYGGEPLLEMSTIERMTKRLQEACEDRQVKFLRSVVTNGYLLTPENQAKLVELGVRSVQVTLDGPRDVHNTRRPLRGGGETYGRIIENLANLHSELRVPLRVNVDKRNRLYISDLLQDLCEQGINHRENIELYFAPVQAVASAVCSDTASYCYTSREFALLETDLYRKAIAMGLRVGRYPSSVFSNCGALTPKGWVISPTGELHKCWNTVGESSMKVGHLLEDSSDEDLANLVRWHAWTPFQEECTNCHVLPLCMGGCAYRDIYRDRVARPTKSRCSAWKYNMDEMLSLYYETKRASLPAGVQRSEEDDVD